MKRALALIEESIAKCGAAATMRDPVPQVLADLRRMALGMGGSIETWETCSEVRRVYRDACEGWSVETTTIKTRRSKQR